MNAETHTEHEKWVSLIAITYEETIHKITKDTSKFILSPMIVEDVVQRFLKHQDVIESYHPSLHGSDPYKQIGYITYWISKLKPVQITKEDPTEHEMFVNEYLAIYFAVSYFYEERNLNLLNKKLIIDLRYTLRYRTLTLRVLPFVFESFVAGFKAGNEYKDQGFAGSFPKVD